MEQYCRRLLISNSLGIRRGIAATIASVLLLPTGLVSLITAPSASASEMPDPVIEAIMGGGTVIGTECVNGKVIESLYQSAAEFKDLGETATLYVKDTSSEGVGVKTRLQRIENGYSWIDTGTLRRDRVTFWNVAGNYSHVNTHYLVPGTDKKDVAEFGSDAGGSAKVPSGQGVYQMRFVSANNTYQILGTMYTAKLNDDLTYSCTAPGTVAPPAPVIREVTPMKDEKGYGVEIVLQPDMSQSIDRYSVQTTIGMNSNIWLPDEFPEAYELEILERTAENTKISIMGSGFENGREYPVAVKAWNGNLESPISNQDSFVAGEAGSTATVERVIHFAEPNGRVQSNIKLDNCGKGGGGKPRGPENCVVGYGYNAKGEGNNWDNTFELWFDVDPGDVTVQVGNEVVEDKEANQGKCSSGDGNGKLKKCFHLTTAHKDMKGEQPITVNDVQVAQWDFFGNLNSGWDGTDWSAYHIFLVEEGVSKNGDLDDTAFTDFCTTEGWGLLPTQDDFADKAQRECQQQGVEVRAVFNYDNIKRADLYWLEAVVQFGENKIGNGDYAFKGMSAGVDRFGAFEGLNTAILESMTSMFEGAKYFQADLSGWDVSNVVGGAPTDFDLGTDYWLTGRAGKSLVRDGTGDGRPIWNTPRVLVSDDQVRAGDGALAKNEFELVWSRNSPREGGLETGSTSGVEYSLNSETWLPVKGDLPEQDLLLTPGNPDDGYVAVNGRSAEWPQEVLVRSQGSQSVSDSFQVFAPCKTEPGDVAVSVTQVPARSKGNVAVQVTLSAGFGVVPPGTVTMRASDGSEIPVAVDRGSASETKTVEWEWKAPGDPRSATTGDLVDFTFGTATASFAWAPENQGDNGPPCPVKSLVISESDVATLEIEFDSAVIDKCEVGTALLDLLSDLQAPGTPRQSMLTARSSALAEPASDSDADGVPDAVDQDLDGDGVQNQVDPDIDGDGTPNDADGDVDGDGLSNGADDFPNGPPPVARPMPIGVTDAERDALLEQLYGEQVPVTFPVPDGDYAEGAGQIVVGPDPEIMVEVAIMNLNDQENFSKLCPDLQLPPELPNPPMGWPLPGPEVGNELPGPEVGNELPDLDGTVFPILPDGGGKPGSESGSGAGSGSESGSAGGSGNLRVALAVPSEAFKGVPTELEAEVYPASTNGYVEFAVQEIDLTGQQSVRILGSAPLEKEQVTVDGQTVTVARASLDLVPADYGGAIVYARVTEKGSGAQDTTARAAVVNPAPFADNFSLTVGVDAWLPVETGNVLGYGYSPVEFTTMTGEAPRITTPVDGPCQVLSTRSIPPQIRMLGTAIAPKRCSFTVTTPGGGAYAPVTYTYDVALSMGTQTATLAADKAKKTIKKGSMVTVAKKTQTKTDEDYKLKGKKITWSVTSGKDVCAVKTSSSGKVSVKGKKKGTCTVRAKAPKVKRKYKSFTEFYNFRVK